MRLHPAHLLCLATLAASIAIGPSIVHTQAPIGRPSAQATSPPLPTVVRPAEDQVVSGDLAIAVQVPAGVPARQFTIEAAYWDPARNIWVYPGTLGADFAGGTNANTTIRREVGLKLHPSATRWRIHVRAVEPPGGWGPWREFTWQAIPTPPPPAGVPQPTPAGTSTDWAAPIPPATGAATSAATPNPGPPGAPVYVDASDVSAQYDKLIAEAKLTITKLNIQIAGLQKQIAGLKVDSKKTLEQLAEAFKQGSAKGKIEALEEHLKANDVAIDDRLNQIKFCKSEVKEVEQEIAKLQKEKALVLAKLSAVQKRRD